jgi:hypothetical protein
MAYVSEARVHIGIKVLYGRFGRCGADWTMRCMELICSAGWLQLRIDVTYVLKCNIILNTKNIFVKQI